MLCVIVLWSDRQGENKTTKMLELLRFRPPPRPPSRRPCNNNIGDRDRR